MDGRTVVREVCHLCLFVHEMKDRGGRVNEQPLVELRRKWSFHRLLISLSPFSLAGRTSD